MDLRDYMAVLRRHLAVVASVTLVCIAAAAFFTIRATPAYASSSQLFVSAAGTDGSNSAFQGSQFALQRVKSYANLNRLAIAKRVVTRLDLDRSPQALANKVTTSAVPDTVLLTVTVEDPSQSEAQRLSQTFSEELVKYVVGLESSGEKKSSASISIVGAASTSGTQVSPKPLRNLLLGAAIGLVLGAAAATLRENLDSTIRSTGRLEEIVDAPCLGTVAYGRTSGKRPLLHGLDPYTPRLEAYRVLRTNLEYLPHPAGPRVFLVTGAVSGEGKSAVAANLAESLAEAGRSVVLLEADMRRPVLASYFGIDGARGLSTLLAGNTSLEGVVQSSVHEKLDIVTSGAVPTNPAELLQSEAMATVMSSLRARYEYVIIDSPPLQPVADAALCAAHADGTILVVRAGRTPSARIVLGLERLEAVGARVVGMVLVKVQTFGLRGPNSRYGASKTSIAAAATISATPSAPEGPTTSSALREAEGGSAKDQVREPDPRNASTSPVRTDT